MAAINYGTVAVVPKGVWDSATQYNVANLVTYDGSSYLAHTRPPIGTLPTDTTYWQVSAQGTNKATADAIGVVKPDGETITVDPAGTISAKKATEGTFGIVCGGSNGVTVDSDGVMSVDTTFTQATELANIIAAEAFSTVLGKISKSIAVTMNLDENALLKNMLSSVDVNDPTKIPTSAYIHQLVERIGMGMDLDSGDSLTAAVNALNSDLATKAYMAYPVASTIAASSAGNICGWLTLPSGVYMLFGLAYPQSGVSYVLKSGAGDEYAISPNNGSVFTCVSITDTTSFVFEARTGSASYNISADGRYYRLIALRISQWG